MQAGKAKSQNNIYTLHPCAPHPETKYMISCHYIYICYIFGILKSLSFFYIYYHGIVLWQI